LHGFVQHLRRLAEGSSLDNLLSETRGRYKPAQQPDRESEEKSSMPAETHIELPLCTATNQYK
jgi:hypothetical protein